MKKIEAKIIADSISPQGNRIISYLLTYPRFIHSELMTHRMFSRNSASSRAIPFEKMVKMVEEDPFIPIAWQKDHKGMQGTEYFDPNQSFRVEDFLESLKTLSDKIDVTLYHRIIGKYSDLSMTLPAWWLFTRDKVLEASILLNVFGVTKQICNRLLEPFMWHTTLVSATEFSNFFKLRCPEYNYLFDFYKSKKDVLKASKDGKYNDGRNFSDFTTEDWLGINSSQAEIHIQALAEAMWDAQNESTPNQLKAGEWHIPFGDRMDDFQLQTYLYNLQSADDNVNFGEIVVEDELKIKIATARCARLSYMTFDGEIAYEKDLKLHDTLLESGHASPFEHACRVLTNEEYESCGKIIPLENGTFEFQKGWVDNFRGYKSHRRILNI